MIDLRNRTVMPGWIDCHVHLSLEIGATSYLDEFRLNEADYIYRSVNYAKTTLMTGFTTVRDAGGGAVISMKRAINQGVMVGENLCSGTAIDLDRMEPTNGYRSDLWEIRD